MTVFGISGYALTRVAVLCSLNTLDACLTAFGVSSMLICEANPVVATSMLVIGIPATMLIKVLFVIGASIYIERSDGSTLFGIYISGANINRLLIASYAAVCAWDLCVMAHVTGCL